MKKSKFNLTHLHSTTLDMGKLIPFLTLDCLPNDTFRISMNSFIRAQPMLAPLMHEVYFYTQYWFVPYRILWEDWQNFITEDLSAPSELSFPIIKTPASGGAPVSSLFDYFGIPVKQPNLSVSALPFRAYSEIYNTRYRDEDLQSEIGISYDGGVDTITNTDLVNVSWKKDYFTTARPSTQRGSQISVPVSSIDYNGEQKVNIKIKLERTRVYAASTLSAGSRFSSASIVSFNIDTDKIENFTDLPRDFKLTLTWSGDAGPDSFRFVATDIKYSFITCVISANVGFASNYYFEVSFNCHLEFLPIETGTDTTGKYSVPLTDEGKRGFSIVNTINNDQVITSDGTNLDLIKTVNAVTSFFNVRDLRLSSAIQRFQEKSLLWGNRYEEYIQREFGIKPRDGRIQRPEYLGGDKSMLQISEVLQTAEGTNTGVGTMRGHGVSSVSQRPIRFTAPEHGVILGLMSIRPRAVYTQGLDRHWIKFNKLDYFVPELANVGMQEVFQQELFATKDNEGIIFGYQDRNSEYRSIRPRVTGEFRDVLNYWNLARNFQQPPTLNSSFIEMQPSKRVFAEQTQNSFLAMLRNNIIAYRTVPKIAKNILK